MSEQNQHSVQELAEIAMGLPPRVSERERAAAVRRLVEQLAQARRALLAGGHRPPGTPSFHMDGCPGCAALAGVSFPARVPHQGDYEPPEVDDWRPGDSRPASEPTEASLTEEGGVNESSSGSYGQQMSPLRTDANDRVSGTTVSTSPPAVSDASCQEGERHISERWGPNR